MVTYTIERAWDDNEKQTGWDIYAHGEHHGSRNWCNRYYLLRDAKHALKLEGIEYTVVK